MLRPVPPVEEIPQATAALARKVHPRGTDEMRVRDALGPLFADTDFTTGVFAEMYSALGQPGLSPALLTMVMILQHRHNLSDEDAARAVADRISWKYALGLDLDDAGFDASVLTEFRTRLAEEGRADGLLALMLDRLKTAGLVKAGGRQRTDSTHAAPRGALSYPRFSREKLGGRFLGPMTHLDLKSEGNRSMSGKCRSRSGV